VRTDVTGAAGKKNSRHFDFLSLKDAALKRVDAQSSTSGAPFVDRLSLFYVRNQKRQGAASTNALQGIKKDAPTEIDASFSFSRRVVRVNSKTRRKANYQRLLPPP
jgi:hypothetical protein